MNVHKSVHLRKQEIYKLIFPSHWNTHQWLGFQKSSLSHMISESFSNIHIMLASQACPLHFTFCDVFRCCDKTQPKSLLYWQVFNDFIGFPPFWNNSITGTIDYWYGDAVHMSRDRTTMLNSNHSSQLTSSITCTGEIDVSSAEQGVEQLSVLNL